MRVTRSAPLALMVGSLWLGACKDDGASNASGMVGARSEDAAAERMAQGGAYQVLANLVFDDGTNLLLKTVVGESRPTIVVMHGRPDQQGRVAQLALNLAKGVEGTPRCESQPLGWICRYLDRTSRTELTFRYEPSKDEIVVAGATWNGRFVDTERIQSRSARGESGNLACDLSSAEACGF